MIPTLTIGATCCVCGLIARLSFAPPYPSFGCLVTSSAYPNTPSWFTMKREAAEWRVGSWAASLTHQR